MVRKQKIFGFLKPGDGWKRLIRGWWEDSIVRVYTKKWRLRAIVRYNSRVVIKWGIWYNLSDRVYFEVEYSDRNIEE